MTTANKRIQAVRNALKDMFVERESVIDGMLVAWLAGEHVLMLGPPGTGKSALARAFSEAVAGGNFFQWLLTKFSTPEELFGPISFTGLKTDKFERVTTGKLPTAKVAFLDEIWKANSSILNSLLTALNEGLFFNGDRVENMPLQMCVGASNEYPEDSSLDALYDRFLLRFWVDYISDRDALRGLLMRAGVSALTEHMDSDDYTDLQKQVNAVPFNGTQTDTLLNIKAAVEENGFYPSDRTWVKVVKLLKAKAVLEGRDHIVASDYMVLCDCLWNDANDRVKLVQIIGNAADPYGSRATAILDAIKLALRDLPDLSMVQNGTITKFDFMGKIAPVDAQLKQLGDKVVEMETETSGNSSVGEARNAIENARESVKALLRKAMDF